MARKKAEQVEAVNQWVCCDKPMSQAECVEHLKSVHGVTEPIQGQRRMMMHMDGQDFFGSTYEWTIGELKLTQVIRQPRAKDDIMRYL